MWPRLGKISIDKNLHREGFKNAMGLKFQTRMRPYLKTHRRAKKLARVGAADELGQPTPVTPPVSKAEL